MPLRDLNTCLCDMPQLSDLCQGPTNDHGLRALPSDLELVELLVPNVVGDVFHQEENNSFLLEQVLILSIFCLKRFSRKNELISDKNMVVENFTNVYKRPNVDRKNKYKK